MSDSTPDMTHFFYDHIVRLPAEAPNRLDDLRKGPLGTFGAVASRTQLFVRERGVDPLVSNLAAGGDVASARKSLVIRGLECFLGFEPCEGSYETAARFVQSLIAALQWEIRWGDRESLKVLPAYQTSGPFIVDCGQAAPWSVSVQPRSGFFVICSLPDATLLEAINIGRYKDVRFGTRIIRASIRVDGS